jgi:hypothetical protein
VIDFDLRSPRHPPPKKSKAKLADDWKSLAEKWQQPFFKNVALQAARCLTDKS